MDKERITIVDSVILSLTTFLFSSFYLFNMNQFGSLILAITTALILLFVVLKNKGKIKVEFSEFHGMVIIFIIYCLLTSLWARSISAVIEKVVTISEILICMSVLYSYFSYMGSIGSMIRVVKWGGAIVSAYTIIVYGFSELRMIVSVGGRFGTTFANTNAITLLAALSAVLIFYDLLYRNTKGIWEVILLLPEIFVISAGGSRKAFFFLFAGASMCILFRFTAKNIFVTAVHWLIIGLLLLFLLQFVISLPFFSGIQSRMEGLIAAITGSGKVDSSTKLRELYITIGLEQFKKTPLFGIGIGNSNYITATIGENTYLHNNFIELLACGGIIGFVCYYGIYVKILLDFIRYKAGQEKYGIICLILLFLFIMMDYGQVSYYSKQTYFYLMMMFIEIKVLRGMKESDGFTHEFSK